MHWHSLERAIFVKFGQLILSKIKKIVATRCQSLWLYCTKLYFGWGYASDPAGELTALPQIPYLDLRRLLLRQGEGKGGGEKSPLIF